MFFDSVGGFEQPMTCCIWRDNGTDFGKMNLKIKNTKKQMILDHDLDLEIRIMPSYDYKMYYLYTYNC